MTWIISAQRPKLAKNPDTLVIIGWHLIGGIFVSAATARTGPEGTHSRNETGGKAAHFPLVGTSIRAFSPDDNLSLEFPGLPDPTDPIDPRILYHLPLMGKLSSRPIIMAPSKRNDDSNIRGFICTLTGLDLLMTDSFCTM